MEEAALEGEAVLVVLVGRTVTRLPNLMANLNNNNTVSLNHNNRMDSPHLQVVTLVLEQVRVHLQSLVEGEHMTVLIPGETHARIC